MKKSELVVGRTYTNGKGRKRKLVARVDRYCVAYMVFDDGTKKNLTHGEIRTISDTAFAAWEKREVVEEE